MSSIPLLKEMTTFEDMQQVYHLESNPNDCKVTLTYRKEIFNDTKLFNGGTMYEYYLGEIKNKIDRCIKKSYANG